MGSLTPRALAALLILTPALPLLAEGFRSPTTGAAGLGTTGGRIVFVDDASAVFHNPANLVGLTQWEAAAEPTLVYHSVEFQSPLGGTARTEDAWKLLPHFFAGGPVAGDRVAAGIGFSTPYGLSIDWEPEGALRYVAPRFVQLKTINANPSVAVRLLDNLSLGAGFDAMWGELTLSQYTPWSLATGIPGLPDGDMRAQSRGIGFSGNAGLTWEFVPHHRLAVTLRAPSSIDFEGDLRITNTPGVPGGDTLLPLESEIRFPTIVTLGYGLEINDRLHVEANVEWLEFSRFESLPLTLPVPLPGLPTEVPQNWEDTFTAGLSATYLLNDHWRLRASYQFFETPVPDETYSPSIPDANQHAVAVGVGYRGGHHRFDLSYSRVFYEDREITGNLVPAFNGHYEIDVHLFSAAYGFRF
ncbi:MAG: TonB-dependent receptor [Verrucomicrobiales bacterium]|nr:TonB-dependent receptor [Verrucomicrobiales bacterium]